MRPLDFEYMQVSCDSLSYDVIHIPLPTTDNSFVVIKATLQHRLSFLHYLNAFYHKNFKVHRLRNVS